MDMRPNQPDAPSASGEIRRTDQLGLEKPVRSCTARFLARPFQLVRLLPRVDRPVVGPPTGMANERPVTVRWSRYGRGRTSRRPSARRAD